MNQKERYQYRKANNLCTHCGSPRDHSEKSPMCLKCIDYVKEWNNKARAVRRADGKCSCGGKPRPGKRTCDNCMKRSKKRQDKLKAFGLCTADCGNPASDGHALCDGCIKKRKDKYHSTKDEVFAAYGGYKCQCCGETIEEFLTIDHENNDGSVHRKALGRKNIYRWLKENGFPSGFQVLCFNCNSGRQINGGICPHRQRQT